MSVRCFFSKNPLHTDVVCTFLTLNKYQTYGTIYHREVYINGLYGSK